MTAPNEETGIVRPCMILAHADAAFSALILQAFRRLGWDVYQARSGPQARRLARMLTPDLVVLDTDLPEESGWLTCDKLLQELPQTRVFLVGGHGDAWSEEFAAFVGAAALVSPSGGVQALVHRVRGMPLPAAG